MADTGQEDARADQRADQGRREHPFEGIGRPEPLKQDLSGWWSRRIDEKHRMVYRVRQSGRGEGLELASLRYHY